MLAFGVGASSAGWRGLVMVAREVLRRLWTAGRVLYQRGILALEDLIKRLPDGEPSGWEKRDAKGFQPPWALIAIGVVTIALIVLALCAKSGHQGAVTSLASACIFFATAAYTWFAMKQWHVQAAQLKQSADVSRLVNRACLVVGTVDTDDKVITVVLKNTGNIEAEAEIRLVGGALDGPTPKTFKKRTRLFEVGRSGGTIPLALVQQRDVAGNVIPLRVFLEARYRDGMAERVPLRACARWDAKTSRYVEDEVGDTFPAWDETPPPEAGSAGS